MEFMVFWAIAISFLTGSAVLMLPQVSGVVLAGLWGAAVIVGTVALSDHDPSGSVLQFHGIALLGVLAAFSAGFAVADMIVGMISRGRRA
ncbi:hypothetical protein [Brevibacterium album]|uniref:hypothetical protein n=1 Tax=Brevibacterium album TaxID=417948 RepID=UPI00048A6BF8|nr:hypothetical protein [Brevibacterium album]